MNNTLYYESGLLSKYEKHKSRMREIVNLVRKKKNLPDINPNNRIPHDHWFKIYDSTVVFDDNNLVGFSLTSECQDFLDDSYWIDFKLWLINNNYDINKIGVNFSYYIHPDYWKRGITKELVTKSISNKKYDYFLSFKFATPEFCKWFEEKFSEDFQIIDTGFPCQNGTKTFLTQRYERDN